MPDPAKRQRRSSIAIRAGDVFVATVYFEPVDGERRSGWTRAPQGEPGHQFVFVLDVATGVIAGAVVVTRTAWINPDGSGLVSRARQFNPMPSFLAMLARRRFRTPTPEERAALRELTAPAEKKDLRN